MSANESEFFFGRVYDLKTKEVFIDKPVCYDPADLVTHAVITGMTGSGKTGLGIILLEEAALQGIPAILIDPKGDLTNHLLHFPDLMPADFEPWVDADAARRDGKTITQAAEQAATSWSKGLDSWGITRERIQELKEKVDYAIYTPGSNSAIPVSILASLKCPEIPWEENKELLRERVSSTVTALLELIGLKNIDPVQSREHILLSNIFENAWSQGNDLDLETLILQTQSPPFEKLGVFSISKFYPEKERFALAMQLNNFLAAPAFGTWLEGQSLDIAKFLYGPNGKPRHSIFYLAHLADAERMFFITLLYSAIETWMRTQSGTTGLRAVVYFDEIVGYLPPIANPPSKPIILRMLKQARAFGVGLVLSTQNPIDVDYKALSNAGTWMIGKLQTDQDKQRLLDGLESLTANLGRDYFDKAISGLGKRVFLLHNVHEKAPVIFSTRWAMNYLPGPITREKLADLNKMVGATIDTIDSSVGKASDTTTSPDTTAGNSVTQKSELGSSTAPVLASSVDIFYLPVNRGISDAFNEIQGKISSTSTHPEYLYKPALIAQARVYYADRTYNVDQEDVVTARIDSLERRGLVRWEDHLGQELDTTKLEGQPLPGASFGELVYPFDDEKNISELSKDFVDWIYRARPLKIYYNDTLKLRAEVGESLEDFKTRCKKMHTKTSDAEVDKIKAKYKKQRDSIELKLKREELELEKDKQALNQRRLEEAGKGLENVLKLIGGRKTSLSTSLTKRRMTSTSKHNVKESEEMIATYQKQLKELDAKMNDEIENLHETVSEKADAIREVTISPLKKNIIQELFGVIWVPYYAFKESDSWVTVKAYK